MSQTPALLSLPDCPLPPLEAIFFQEAFLDWTCPSVTIWQILLCVCWPSAPVPGPEGGVGQDGRLEGSKSWRNRWYWVWSWQQHWPLYVEVSSMFLQLGQCGILLLLPILEYTYWDCKSEIDGTCRHIRNYLLCFMLCSINECIFHSLFNCVSCPRNRNLVHCWWDPKIVQPLWKTVWQFFRH